MEKRKPAIDAEAQKATSLPSDYTKVVKEVFETQFKDSIQNKQFTIEGKIWPDEILFAASLGSTGSLKAVTVFCSVDFDPNASLPTAEELLAACVDVCGHFFQHFFQENPDPIDLRPLVWTPYEWSGRTAFVRVDQSNLQLDQMTEEWLNSPVKGRA